MHELSLNDEMSSKDEMIPQANQIPVWITNRHEHSHKNGTNFRSGFDIASSYRRSTRNLINVSLDKSVNINNNRSLPSVMLVNARSLFKKSNELEVVAKMQEIDIVCITETWLKDKIPDEAIDCLGMNLCRLDRTSGAGGGVAVFINNMIPFKVREDLISKSFECIWITIRPTWLPREISRICISCVYLPPCETDVEGFYEYFYNCYDKLCMESPNSAFIVAGDFNPTSNGFQNRYLKTHCNFKQVVKKATRGNNILDLIFTNIAGFYQVPCILAPLSTSDHCIVVWKPRDPRYSMKGKVLKVKHRDMRHANMNAFGSALENYDWHQILYGGDIDEKVNRFTLVVNSMIEKFFPESTSRRHSKDKPFITHKIKSLISKRNKPYSCGKIELFRSLRAQVSREIRKAKSTFYDKKIRPKRTTCSKSWWKQIKRLTGKVKDSVTLIDPETELELDNKQSATIINDFFADLTKDYPRINEEWIELQCSDSLPYVNVEHVQKQLMKINVNKAPGPNDPVLKILKDFAYVLAVPLTEIFNDSFREKYFPKMWKQYKLKGIPKSLPCSTVDNLRPIALTSVLSKVQESFVVDWINEDIHDKISE